MIIIGTDINPACKYQFGSTKILMNRMTRIIIPKERGLLFNSSFMYLIPQMVRAMFIRITKIILKIGRFLENITSSILRKVTAIERNMRT